jgi:hypothetical protein
VSLALLLVVVVAAVVVAPIDAGIAIKKATWEAELLAKEKLLLAR